MMAMVQRLDARGFFFDPQLSGAFFLTLVFQVGRNRSRCHGLSVAELAASKLSALALCQRSAISEWGDCFRGTNPISSAQPLKTI